MSHHHLVARADVVVDIHSGGKTLDFVPSVVMHELEDAALMERTRAAILAMGAPLAMVLKELDTAGMLDSAVEEARQAVRHDRARRRRLDDP